MRVRLLAGMLFGVAGALTGLAAAQPSLVTIANATLFWAWSLAGLRVAHQQANRVYCASCGGLDPMRLPDGSCARCAAPAKRSRPTA